MKAWIIEYGPSENRRNIIIGNLPSVNNFMLNEENCILKEAEVLTLDQLDAERRKALSFGKSQGFCGGCGCCPPSDEEVYRNYIKTLEGER